MMIKGRIFTVSVSAEKKQAGNTINPSKKSSPSPFLHELLKVWLIPLGCIVGTELEKLIIV